MDALVTHEAPTRACCQQADTLDPRDSGRPDLELRVCRVCGARHFELTIDSIPLGVELTQ